jgi:ATP-dependent DNA ligase
VPFARAMGPLEAWAQVVGRRYEGLVAKDQVSAYESEHTKWLKVKQKDWTVGQDLVASAPERA